MQRLRRLASDHWLLLLFVAVAIALNRDRFWDALSAGLWQARAAWQALSVRDRINFALAVCLVQLLLPRLLPKPLPTKRVRVDSLPTDSIRVRGALYREAQWVYAEMTDFVRLVQRYRALYVTAVFATIGWLLNQALSTSAALSPPSGSTAVPAATAVLAAWQTRADIAAVLCLIPLLNALFVVLMFEAQFQMQSLARYRFIIGAKLGEDLPGSKRGDGRPMWRWELWKKTDEGTIRPWTNVSNVLFGCVTLTFPIVALWFCSPAVWRGNSDLLKTFWSVSASVFAIVLWTAIYLGIKFKDRNNVAADVPKNAWDGLGSR